MIEDYIVLIATIAFIVILSPYIAKVTNVPTTPIEIILGAIFGYAGFLYGEQHFEFIAEVGFIYLMFLAGTEINIKTVMRIERALVKGIALYLTALYALSVLAVWYFGFSLIFIVLLPLISVGLVAALTKEYGKTPWLTLSMTAGGIGEVISIALLTLSSAILEFGVGFDLARIIATLVIFMFVIILIFRLLQLFFWWFPQVSTALMPHDDNKDKDIRLSMGILLLLLVVMMYLHLELAFAAFIAGMFIPTFFEHKDELPEKLGSFGFGFLVPIFFIYIGSTFKLEALMMPGLIEKALLITSVMIGIRVIATQFFTTTLGWRNALLHGLSHAMPLTLLIALTTIAYNNKSIDELHYYALILASLFEVILVMIAIKMIQKKAQNSI